ncbi:MAG TPA: metallophosphoesterase family protein [candidate division Zixibacteria bacterium]|nr:metallophosphoesterase family protein [candidate division Zixibacteria bacterium]
MPLRIKRARLCRLPALSLPQGRVGLISDTHGLLRPEAVAALQGSELIIHAGDIGGPGVLEGLRRLCPVAAVRGNNDRGAWARGLPLGLELRINDFVCYVVHDLRGLGAPPEPPAVVISGHSHRPKVEKSPGALFVNPGSAGPRRFKLPVTVARLTLGRGSAGAEIVEIL